MNGMWKSLFIVLIAIFAASPGFSQKTGIIPYQIADAPGDAYELLSDETGTFSYKRTPIDTFSIWFWGNSYAGNLTYGDTLPGESVLLPNFHAYMGVGDSVSLVVMDTLTYHGILNSPFRNVGQEAGQGTYRPLANYNIPTELGKRYALKYEDSEVFMFGLIKGGTLSDSLLLPGLVYRDSLEAYLTAAKAHPGYDKPADIFFLGIGPGEDQDTEGQIVNFRKWLIDTVGIADDQTLFVSPKHNRTLGNIQDWNAFCLMMDMKYEWFVVKEFTDDGVFPDGTHTDEATIIRFGKQLFRTIEGNTPANQGYLDDRGNFGISRVSTLNDLSDGFYNYGNFFMGNFWTNRSSIDSMGHYFIWTPDSMNLGTGVFDFINIGNNYDGIGALNGLRQLTTIGFGNFSGALGIARDTMIVLGNNNGRATTKPIHVIGGYWNETTANGTWMVASRDVKETVNFRTSLFRGISATSMALGDNWILNLADVPANGEFLQYTGGVAVWGAAPSGGTPGGSTTQIQYNNAGAFGGTATFTYANATGLLTYTPTLDEATGDEVMLNINGTVNKATSGNYVGLRVNAIETAAPGTADRLLALAVGGVNQFQVANDGEMILADGVRQTFNPNATNAGLNVGSQSGDPSSPSNGDLVYNTSTNKFRAYENGAWTDVIGGAADGNGIYDGNGSLSGTTTVTMGTNNLTFSASGSAIFSVATPEFITLTSSSSTTVTGATGTVLLLNSTTALLESADDVDIEATGNEANIFIDSDNNTTTATFKIGANDSAILGGSYTPLLTIEEDGQYFLEQDLAEDNALNWLVAQDSITGELKVVKKWTIGGGGGADDGFIATDNATLTGARTITLSGNNLVIAGSANTAGALNFSSGTTASINLASGNSSLNLSGSTAAATIIDDDFTNRNSGTAQVFLDSDDNATTEKFEIGANATSTGGGTYDLVARFEEDGTWTIGQDPVDDQTNFQAIARDPSTGELEEFDVMPLVQTGAAVDSVLETTGYVEVWRDTIDYFTANSQEGYMAELALRWNNANGTDFVDFQLTVDDETSTFTTAELDDLRVAAGVDAIIPVTITCFPTFDGNEVVVTFRAAHANGSTAGGRLAAVDDKTGNIILILELRGATTGTDYFEVENWFATTPRH